MKKFVYSMLGVLAVLITVVIIFTASEPEFPYYKKAEVVQKLDNDESFLLVLGSSTCSYCKQYKAGALGTYIKKSQEYPLVYVELDKANFLGDEDLDSFLIKYNLKQDLNGTPTTYLIQNGEKVAAQGGAITYKQLQKFIEDNK